jgi:hypothetical protein
MPPTTISHPATTKQPTTINGSPQQLPTHFRQPPSNPSERISTFTTDSKKISYNQTQCNSTATETCHRSSRRRLFINSYRRRSLSTQQNPNNTMSTFTHTLNRPTSTHHSPGAWRGQCHKCSSDFGIAGGFRLFTVQPPAHGSNQNLKPTHQSAAQAHNRRFLLKLTTQINESSAQLKVAP